MLIHGFPPAARLNEEGRDRFWYWRGASGRSYIHSIYASEDCPPLPGAVYIAVKRLGPMRIAVAAGRFPACFEKTSGARGRGLASMADEIHVHLLARDEAGAEGIRRDLDAALTPQPYQSAAA